MNNPLVRDILIKCKGSFTTIQKFGVDKIHQKSFEYADLVLKIHFITIIITMKTVVLIFLWKPCMIPF